VKKVDLMKKNYSQRYKFHKNKPLFFNTNNFNKFYFADIKRCFVSLNHPIYCLILKQLLNMG